MEIIQEFASMLYDQKTCKSVDLARLFIFQKLFADTSAAEFFCKGVKSFDSSTIPPCWKSLKQKLLRTIYINSMWQNATKQECIILDINQCGWEKTDDTIKPIWFGGDPTPLTIDDISMHEINCNDDEEVYEQYNVDVAEEENEKKVIVISH